jgi:hypothetical protein
MLTANKLMIPSSEEVPGLATEEKTLEGLIEKLKIMIPELLDANGAAGLENEVPFEIFTRRFEIAQRTGC